jgi:vancomycin resistance protein YoaR
MKTRLYRAFVAAAGMWLAVFLAVYIYAARPVLPSGLTVSGWRVQGLSYAKFEEQLERRIEQLNLYKVRLADPGGRAAPAELTLGELGLRVEAKPLLDAVHSLRQGSLLKRAGQRWRLSHRELPLSVLFDRSAMEQAVKQTWKTLYDEQPVDAQRIITPDDRIELVPGKDAYRIDLDRLAAALSTLATGPAWVSQGKEGPAELALPLIAVPPAVTLDILKAQGIERKLIEFSTSFPTRDEGRIHNIRATAQTIHDRLLKPGEIFDYGEVIRQTEETFGFREAPVIVNGKIVPGIGGGICQVSTTLYNAVLRAGLEVVERRNHSLPVSYIALGQDATFASGHINFKFRNNTESYLLIRTETDERRITVKLFGNAPGNVTYDIESKIVETIPPPVKYVRNPALPIGGKQLILQGKPGYVVETYRITKQDGNVVAETKISRDTYSPQPTVIATNTGKAGQADEAVPPRQQIVEDGVKGPVFP